MRRLLAVLACLMACSLAWGDPGAAGSQPADLRKLFPQEADLAGAKGGLARLVLPAEILAACRPDLSDLRLFDPQGNEVPFLLDAGVSPPTVTEVIQKVTPAILEATRQETKRVTGPPLRRETFEIALPETAPQTGAWDLIVQIRAREFVARVSVEGIGADKASIALVNEGSVFRLPGSHSAEKDRLPLPPFHGRRLRVSLETEHSFWLEPSLQLESARVLERGSRIAVPLETLARRTNAGRTVINLSRPRGIVPDLLRLETSTGTFDRQMSVWDDGPTGQAGEIGSGRMFRVEALAPVGEQELGLGVASGDRLRVEIEDGDSPPLADLSFAAVIRQPSLIFSLPPVAADGTAGVLRFGGGRAHRPHYDLSGLLPAQGAATGKRAEAAALLYDPATVHPTTLGAIRPNPLYDSTPALAFAMHPGAALDRRIFSHHRPLDVTTAAEGLSRLRLEPEDLAILNDEMSDLRIADSQSRQWPYLVAREAATEFIPLVIKGPESKDSASKYMLTLPVAPIRFDRVLLDADAGFFDRAFHLDATGDKDGTRTLARGRLARPIGDPRPVSIEVSPARVTSLTLVVEDGDDAPLTFRSVQVRVSLPEVYLTAPAGRYDLLIGAPHEDAAHYELEQARDVVLAVKAAPVHAGSLEANPDFSLQARLKSQGLRQTVFLWTTLIAAVVVLAILTLRLSRREPSASA